MLDERTSSVLWSGTNIFPPEALIKHVTLELIDGRITRTDKERCTVQSRVDTVSIILRCVQHELNDLRLNFYGNGRNFSTSLLFSTDGSEANIVIRLTTKELEGGSQYRFSWRCIGGGLCACDAEYVIG